MTMKWFEVTRRQVNIHTGLVQLTELQAALFNDDIEPTGNDDEYNILKPIQIRRGEVFACDQKLHPHNVKELRRQPIVEEIDVPKIDEVPAVTTDDSVNKIIEAFPGLNDEAFDALWDAEKEKEKPRVGLLKAFEKEELRRETANKE